MSRGFATAGAGLACLCGVLISYSTLRPELEKQKDIREGTFNEQHQIDDKAVSRAIMSDFKEAGQQVRGVEKGGFAWGIRQAIWGKPDSGGQAASERSKADGNESQKKG